jgi:hypothetical protein
MLRRIVLLVVPLLLVAGCAEGAATGYPPGSPAQFAAPSAGDDGQPVVTRTPDGLPPAPVAVSMRVNF